MRIRPLLSLIFLAAIVSCAPAQKQYEYNAPTTPGGRMCSGQCSEAQAFCQQSCDIEERQCALDIQSQALKDYDHYTRDQFISHQPIELHPRDFERLTPCTDSKSSCMESCQNTFQSCYSGCGGKVDTQTSCQFLCF
ncbi:MAG TPA: hypothetical protein VFR09_04065 [Alphaproteobacteria bacterium]|nr:hypothetical protein [Alphaproteobacteria bacterium]